ncbi:MAG: hypothetical protein WDA09_04650 [Bacteriovoracaceae bacterium]
MTIHLENQYRGESFKAPPILIPEKDHGYYHSANILKSPQFVYEFLQNPENVKASLQNLPEGIENFLDLELMKANATDADEYEVVWENLEDSIVSGAISFHCQRAPENRGTILLAQASFSNFSTSEDDPSELIRFFIKRLKALMETGVIATTKGQPSGREELNLTH